MKRKIRVMLVEDHPEYRDVLEIAIQKETDLELAGTFGASEVALRSLQSLATRKEADVILLDLHLPGMSGLEALPHFKASIPGSKIIILTQSNKEAEVLHAISLGADGYLLKSSTIKQIKEAVRGVVAGDTTLDAGVAKYIIEKIRSKAPQETPEKALSARELEILILLGEGLVKKEIGDKLDITYGTVATHIRHIYEKLNVVNAPAAITKAYRAGIFPTRAGSD